MVRRRARSFRLAALTPILVVFFVLSHGDDVPTQTPALPTYGVLDFGTLGGAAAASEDIEEFGRHIVGQAQTASGAIHATAVIDGVLTDLGTLGGAASVAYGASAGFAVGQAQTATGETHAFSADLWGPETGTMTDLGTLGGTWSAAYSTSSGSVVGASTLAGSSRLQAFMITYATNGLMQAVPVNAAGDSVARDVFADEVVGYACTAGNASCGAFWFKEGVSTLLPSLGGNSAANAINWSPQAQTSVIVGASVTADGSTTHAFRYVNGTMTDLGTLGGPNSEALEVNGLGDVVGVSDVPGGGTHAFLWRNGTMFDLNTVLPSGSGWVLQRATGISEAGQIVGVGTLDGAPRAFLLTPPADLSVWQGGQRSQTDSNLPRGVEVGRTIRIVNSVIGMPDPLTLYGARYTATLTGPAEYVPPARGYDTDGTECQVALKTIICEVPPIDTIGFGREYGFTIRTTGPGTITHQASVTSNTPDTNSANNTLTEENFAVALSGFSLTPSTVAGGKASSARVTLTGTPPGGDAVVRLSSSRSDIAPVPETLVVPYHNNSPTRAFNIIPATVSQPTPVDITATYGGVTITQTLTVVPTALAQLYLTPTTIIGGCGTSAGKIALTGAAPPGGAVVTLTNTNSQATVPGSVTVPAGALSQTFTVTTATVTANQAGTVTASYGGVSQALTVTVRPIRVATLALSPNPVTGGANASASVTLECAAPPGGAVVTLSSSNAPVAAPTVSSISIPAGATTGTFTVRTAPVTANISVNIYATVYGVRKAAGLTVRP
jgi:probable HAF family extracellular repeat protein